jgi:hypothetical protein
MMSPFGNMMASSALDSWLGPEPEVPGVPYRQDDPTTGDVDEGDDLVVLLGYHDLSPVGSEEGIIWHWKS